MDTSKLKSVIAETCKTYIEDELVKDYKFDATKQTITLKVDVVETEYTVDIKLPSSPKGNYVVSYGKQREELKGDDVKEVLMTVLTKFENQRDAFVKEYGDGETPSGSDDEEMNDSDEDDMDDDDSEKRKSNKDDEDLGYEIADDEAGDTVDEHGFLDPSQDPIKKEQDWSALDPAELVRKQQNEILDVSEILGVPFAVSGALLRAYRWNREKLFTDFFDDQTKVCKKVGVSLSDFGYKTGDPNKTYTCGICYEDWNGNNMFALSCNHFVCKTCWKEYIAVQINDGPSCLMMTCPAFKCKIIVDETLVSALMDKENKTKYGKFLARSFIDDNPHIKWCPAPDCGRAVYCPDSGSTSVRCSCGFRFCFKCNSEAHAPCTCEMLRAWKKKAADESETANWLTANTKDCPKCKRAIEKNGGCNHMTCSQCKHEWCWVCLDDWKYHSGSTGGYYKCNRFKPEELDKKTKSMDRQAARIAIEKYMHYFKRYANHEQSQKFESKLRQTAEEKMRELQIKNKYSSWIDVEHIKKAVEQLIECRNVLKYTYIYGYYMEDGPEKNLFEYLQEDLERVTEHLSGILEGPVEKFDRDEVLNTTKSGQTRLQHLLKGVEQGLTMTK